MTINIKHTSNNSTAARQTSFCSIKVQSEIICKHSNLDQYTILHKNKLGTHTHTNLQERPVQKVSMVMVLKGTSH